MRILALILLLASVSAHGAMTEGGQGILFGDDHGFAVTATPGWMLDNQSGVRQGLHMVFYPKGETWADSPAIIYGRAVPTKHSPTVELHVKNTVRDFRAKGSPDYTAEAQAPLPLPDGRQAEVYHFSGDQWGNYEAAAYFQEADTINFLVFNARTKADFEKYIGDFLQIAGTYQNLHTPPTSLSPEHLTALRNEAASMLTKPGGKEYETKAAEAIGQTLANAVQQCSSYLQGKEPPPFRYLVRINSDGGVDHAYISPANAMSICFKGLMHNAGYPPHPFDSFLLDIDMRISPQ